jgi:hypothetical protein
VLDEIEVLFGDFFGMAMWTKLHDRRLLQSLKTREKALSVRGAQITSGI